jgi:arylsulfatase A-like enzyme
MMGGFRHFLANAIPFVPNCAATAGATTSMDRMTLPRQRGPAKGARSRSGALDVLLVSVWCGLVAGLTEVAARVAYRTYDPTGRLYFMSRHFVWLIPLANLLVFLGLGLFLAGMTRLWPRLGWWLASRGFGALVILPVIVVVGEGIHLSDLFLLALGIAVWLVPWLQGRAPNPRRFLIRSLPVLLASILLPGGSILANDWLKQRREAARALPAPDSRNVLLIVLDTVRADRLSLYGYGRPTTPNLERLAQRGVRFDAARATAPWTLPSHAGFFTGRWPHELDARWRTPLRTSFPMLAEYLSARGYATAGVVANAAYCSYETGLGRGFTYYDDYKLARLGFLSMAIVVHKFLTVLNELNLKIAGDPPFSLSKWINHWFYSGDRRDAAAINFAFLEWLSRRPEPGRPFFAFLNFFDAHAPYRLPDGATPRIGPQPETEDEIQIVFDKWTELDKATVSPYYVNMASDAYDNCIAYLDEQLGALFDELDRRGVLQRTLVLVLSDHGEGLGEHDLFGHGYSLHSTEIRVPLLILPPAGAPAKQQVGETVSLRDVPATVVDLVGSSAGAPFPGRSLARLWRESSTPAFPVDDAGAVSELLIPNPFNPGNDRSPARSGPWFSVADGDFVYIRNDGDGTEQLFNRTEDPRELSNRARHGAFGPVLEQFRERLNRIMPAAPRPRPG